MKLCLISNPENKNSVYPDIKVLEQDEAIKFLSNDGDEPGYSLRYVKQFCESAMPGDWTILNKYIVFATEQGSDDWPIPF